VSSHNVPRDLNALCEESKLRRLHGGAEFADGSANVPYACRSVLDIDAKQRIAVAVVSLVPAEAKIFILIGTQEYSDALRKAGCGDIFQPLWHGPNTFYRYPERTRKLPCPHDRKTSLCGHSLFHPGQAQPDPSSGCRLTRLQVTMLQQPTIRLRPNDQRLRFGHVLLLGPNPKLDVGKCLK
jgi:hypothetical protein